MTKQKSAAQSISQRSISLIARVFGVGSYLVGSAAYGMFLAVATAVIFAAMGGVPMAPPPAQTGDPAVISHPSSVQVIVTYAIALIALVLLAWALWRALKQYIRWLSRSVHCIAQWMQPVPSIILLTIVKSVLYAAPTLLVLGASIAMSSLLLQALALTTAVLSCTAALLAGIQALLWCVSRQKAGDLL